MQSEYIISKYTKFLYTSKGDIFNSQKIIFYTDIQYINCTDTNIQLDDYVTDKNHSIQVSILPIP